MVITEKIFIDNNEVKIEAEYFQASSNIHSAILLCHPHPQYGGNMQNNVVSALFNIFIKENISCLRFNFRAVGKSTGNHTSGKGELSDVKACIQYLLIKKNVKKLLICGYSYGAAIGCSAVNDSVNIIGFIAISFPWDFIGHKYKSLSQTDKPKLFIQGNRDDIAVYSKFNEHYKFYDDPKEFKIINGADHLYWGYEQKIAEESFEFYNKLIQKI